MKKVILNNWKLKLLSVVIAFLVWLLVVNYDNPTRTYTITGIPIEVTNTEVITDQDMTYTVQGSQTATIRVECRRKIGDSLKAGDFRAVADFSSLYSVTSQVPVTVTCTSSKVTSAEITQVTQSLEVSLENLLTQRMQIDVDVTGTPTTGYMVGEAGCSPSIVTVRAPASFLDTVSHVGVEVNVDDVSRTVSRTAPLQFYSAGGSVLDTSGVSDLTVSTTDIDVTVDILNVKTVNIDYGVTGQDQVAEGYRYTGIELTPDSVDIAGEQSVMAAVTSLTLPEGALDVTGASEDITKTLDLRDCLPAGVSLVDGEAYNVTVVLKIEKLATKTLTMDLSNIAIENLDPALALASEDATMSVTVEGLSRDLTGLTADELSGTIDLAGLTAGTHSVAADIAVPSGFSIVGTVSVRLQLVPAQESTESGG